MSHYKPYPAYKDSGVEWLGRVPEHWDVTRISNHYRLRNGFPFDSSGFSPDGDEADRLIRIRDLSPSETWIYTSETCPESARIEDGDVLVGMDGDFNAVLWKAGPAKLNQRVCALRGETEFLTKFLLYSLPFPLQIINDTAYSTTVKHLSSGEVLGTRIALPPPFELSSIVSHLDRETARIDALVAKKTRFIELLREKRQALITHAVTKGLDPNVRMKDSGVEWLGEVPEHWVTAALRYLLADIFNGLSVEQIDEADDVVPVTRIETISKGVIDFSRTGFIKRSDSTQRSRLLGGDICFSNINSLNMIGNCARYCGGAEIYAGMNLLVLRPKSSVDHGWLYWLLASGGFRRLVEANAKPAINQASIGQGTLTSLMVGIPPYSEQKAISSHLDHETSRIDSLRAKTERSIDLLKERRVALITSAITGQIDLR